MPKIKKILILSDTHGLVLPIQEIIQHHPDCSAIFHCGDSELMNFDPTLKKMHVVRGNCDYDRTLPNDLTIDIGKHKIYSTHGHLYGVKSSLDQLATKAQSMNADIALYGHSHVAKVDHINGVTLINPGSIAYPRGRKEPTYAILTLDNDACTVDFYHAHNHTMMAIGA